MSTSVRKTTWLVLLALGVGACSEGTTAPVGLSPEASGPLMSSGSDGVSGRGQDIGSRVFTIWPGIPTGQKFGDHVLFIPGDATCEPATSGYGAAYWDLPCTPLQAPLQVTATWTVRADGQPVVSFSPDLRFAPSDDPSRWVNLSLKSVRGIDPNLHYAILWYDKAAGKWVDEATTDPTLRARTSQSGNLVTRRLKHFSDYWLYAGFGAYNVTSGLEGIEILGIGGSW
jgi:hypothetical protein